MNMALSCFRQNTIQTRDNSERLIGLQTGVGRCHKVECEKMRTEKNWGRPSVTGVGVLKYAAFPELARMIEAQKWPAINTTQSYTSLLTTGPSALNH
jgi:hypothetical protein